MKRLSIFMLSISFTITYSQNFKISKKINVAGSCGWDYLSVNESDQQLFVSHGSVVNVIDLKTDKTIATIPEMQMECTVLL